MHQQHSILFYKSKASTSHLFYLFMATELLYSWQFLWKTRSSEKMKLTVESQQSMQSEAQDYVASSVLPHWDSCLSGP